MSSAWAIAIIRWGLFMALWIVLMGVGKAADLIVGGLTALVATKVSLWLLPTGLHNIRLRKLAWYFPHFLWQSVLSGWDVARRALHPKLPLATGLVRYPSKHSPGFLRNTFSSLTSLLPGTVATGEDDKHLEYHTLDTQIDVCASLNDEAHRLVPVLKEGKVDE